MNSCFLISKNLWSWKVGVLLFPSFWGDTHPIQYMKWFGKYLWIKYIISYHTIKFQTYPVDKFIFILFFLLEFFFLFFPCLLFGFCYWSCNEGCLKTFVWLQRINLYCLIINLSPDLSKRLKLSKPWRVKFLLINK